MGLGRLLNRSINYVATDTTTGESQTYTVVTPDFGAGMYPDWGSETVLGIPAVFRAVSLVSDLVGGFPWDGPEVLDNPNPGETRASTIGSLVFDYLLHGNSIAVLVRDDSGEIAAVVPVPASHVQIRLVEGRRKYRIGEDDYDQDDVFHAKGPAYPGELRGLSRLELFTATFDLSRDQERSARGASNSGVPTGLLRVSDPDATEEHLLAVKAGWTTAQRTRSIAVLNATTEFEPLAWNPSESQLLDARRFSIHEIGLIFGLPLSFLGVESNTMTYSNGENEGLNLLRFTINGILSRFEQEFSLAFGQPVKANVDSLLRSDTKTRYETHKIGIDAGFLTIDEARQLEDRNPLG